MRWMLEPFRAPPFTVVRWALVPFLARPEYAPRLQVRREAGGRPLRRPPLP